MEEITPKNKSLPFIVAAVIIVIGAIIAYASGVFKENPLGKDNDNDTTPTQTTDNSTPSTVPSQTNSQKYNDGTYSVTQTYRSPGGNEKFGLSLTLANGVVTDASFTPEPVSPTGMQKQNAFNSTFKGQVVGKNINDVSVGVIAGASLTSAAFMSALQSIKTQASAS